MAEPVDIPNANQCRVNHGLITAVPSEDITFGVFRRLGYKMRLKSLQKQQAVQENNNFEVAVIPREIEELEKQLQEVDLE